MSDEAAYNAQMEEVKKNCPFCKIVKGEIPSKKVYEDDKILAILDINPHRKGHLLVLPKEHYPILPLVPADVCSHMFKIIKDLSVAAAKGTINKYANVFVANGAAAGQQSQHFMLHIIPNESKGGFEIGEGKVSNDDLEKTFGIFSNNLPIMMKNHFGRNPDMAPKPKEEPKSVEEENAKQQLENPSIFANMDVDQIVDALMGNEQVLDVLMNDADKFKEMIPSHPQLSAMFEKVSVDEVISKLKGKISGSQPKMDGNDLSGVVDIVMENDLVRDAMMQDITKFKELVPQNESLSKLFSNVNIDEVFNQVKQRLGK